jgi:hypothetical protein
MSLPQVQHNGQLLKTKANCICSKTRKVKAVLVELDGQMVWLDRAQFTLPTFDAIQGGGK